MTREQMQERRKTLEQQRDALLAQLNFVAGQMALLDELLTEPEQEQADEH